MFEEKRTDTEKRFNEVMEKCDTLRIAKRKDYGDSWKVLRPGSNTDQIFIKALRIRSIQEKKGNAVGDPLDAEFVGIINYSLMGIYSLSFRDKDMFASNPENDDKEFLRFIDDIRKLLNKKNHDYGEAWRNLRISSMTDLIIVKILRLQKIEMNNYTVEVSESALASYQDIINYSVFCLILMGQGADPLV